MALSDPFKLADHMRPDGFRVRSPSTVVFLCGGLIDRTKVAEASCLRDAFWRLFDVTALDYTLILAEDANPLTTEAGYSDLFSFESDVAQVVGLILLFAESPGSLAELGAFAALPTVAPSLLAVLDDHHYDQVSFIRNGPIKFLEHRYGDDWILVLERSHVGIGTDGKIGSLDAKAFMSSIVPAIQKRLDARPDLSRFASDNSGHLILFVTGLCQEFGALTAKEIRVLLAKFGLPEERLDSFLYCATMLGWLKKVRKGNHIFYVATATQAALEYTFISGSMNRDKTRWRSDIRDYWKANDPSRMRAIADVIAPPVSL